MGSIRPAREHATGNGEKSGEKSGETSQPSGFGTLETGYAVIGWLAAILGLTLLWMNANAITSGEGKMAMALAIGMTIGLLTVETGLLWAKHAIKKAQCSEEQAQWLDKIVFCCCLFIFSDFFLVLQKGTGGWFSYVIGAEAGVVLYLYHRAIRASDWRTRKMVQNGHAHKVALEEMRDQYANVVAAMEDNQAKRDITAAERRRARQSMLNAIEGIRARWERSKAARHATHSRVATTISRIAPQGKAQQPASSGDGQASEPPKLSVNAPVKP